MIQLLLKGHRAMVKLAVAVEVGMGVYSFLQPTHVSQLTKRDSLSFTHQNFPSLFYTHLLLEIKGPCARLFR